MKRSSRILVSTVVSVSNFLIVSLIGSRIDRAAAEADFMLATPLEGIVAIALMFPAILLPEAFELASLPVVVLLNSVAWGFATYFVLGAFRRAP